MGVQCRLQQFNTRAKVSVIGVMKLDLVCVIYKY